MPGFDSLHRMVSMLLAERAPENARILVLGAGGGLALAHISFPQTEPERAQWIARHVAYAAAPDADPAQLQQSRDIIGARLAILAPEEEEAMLRQAGFTGVALFYAGMSFRGWVAYKSD